MAQTWDHDSEVELAGAAVASSWTSVGLLQPGHVADESGLCGHHCWWGSASAWAAWVGNMVSSSWDIKGNGGEQIGKLHSRAVAPRWKGLGLSIMSVLSVASLNL